MTIKADDKVFFSRCIEDNMDALYGVALRLTRRQADAEDLVAEAVTKAWISIGTLEDKGSFRPWVFRILRNCYISDYRKKSIRPTEAIYDELADGSEDGDVCSMLELAKQGASVVSF
jgi:RNA polymerase sigma-70 factor (ECF subfamily)